MERYNSINKSPLSTDKRTTNVWHAKRDSEWRAGITTAIVNWMIRKAAGHHVWWLANREQSSLFYCHW